MAFTWQLDTLRHDIKIRNGRIQRVSGSDEVRQRVKVALWHYLGEYFLDTTRGVPWYQEILGRKRNANDISSILRAEILRVPGVLRIRSFNLNFDSFNRIMSITGDIEVQSGLNETASIAIDINGLTE